MTCFLYSKLRRKLLSYVSDLSDWFWLWPWNSLKEAVTRNYDPQGLSELSEICSSRPFFHFVVCLLSAFGFISFSFTDKPISVAGEGVVRLVDCRPHCPEEKIIPDSKSVDINDMI